MKYLLTLFLPLIALAHPHFLVDTTIQIEPDIIKLDWRFDRINSKLLFFEFDTNKDKKLDKKEVDSMIEKFFLPLKNDNFFLMIQSEDDELEINPKQINIEYSQKKLHINYALLMNNFKGGIVCNIDATTYFAFHLHNHSSSQKLEIEKSQYDFCIGVNQ